MRRSIMMVCLGLGGAGCASLIGADFDEKVSDTASASSGAGGSSTGGQGGTPTTESTGGAGGQGGAGGSATCGPKSGGKVRFATLFGANPVPGAGLAFPRRTHLVPLPGGDSLFLAPILTQDVAFGETSIDANDFTHLLVRVHADGTHDAPRPLDSTGNLRVEAMRVGSEAPEDVVFLGHVAGPAEVGDSPITPPDAGTHWAILSVPLVELFNVQPTVRYAVGPTDPSPFGGIAVDGAGALHVTAHFTENVAWYDGDTTATTVVPESGTGARTGVFLVDSALQFNPTSQLCAQSASTWKVGPVAPVGVTMAAVGILDDDVVCGVGPEVTGRRAVLRTYPAGTDWSAGTVRVLNEASYIAGISEGSPGWVAYGNEEAQQGKIYVDRVIGAPLSLTASSSSPARATAIATGTEGRPVIAAEFEGSLKIGSVSNADLGGAPFNAAAFEVDPDTQDLLWSWVLGAGDDLVNIDAAALASDGSVVLITGRIRGALPEALATPGSLVPPGEEHAFVVGLCP